MRDEKKAVQFRHFGLHNEVEKVKTDSARFAEKMESTTFEQMRDILHTFTDGEKTDCGWSGLGFKETIAGIVDDIRAQNQGLPEDSYALSPFVCDLLSITDRIEAAYNRERETEVEVARRDIDTVICRYGRLVKKLRSENKRLLSALKPILDAYISQDDPSVDVYDSRLDAAVCVRAVRDAKRIYGGGDK